MLEKGKKRIEDKEKKIKEKAMISFREKGVEKTSIRDIMKDTKFGLGTFYLYFKNKKNLEQKIVLDLLVELFYKAEKQCTGNEPVQRYISFMDYILDYFIAHPIEFELISKNINWALYAKIENDERFEEVDSILKFVLAKFSTIFPENYTKHQQLYILSLTMHTVISTCKHSLNKDGILTIDEMKPVLFKLIEKIFKEEEK